MSWSTEGRKDFVRALDGVDRVVVACYRILLALIAAGVVVVVTLVIKWRPWGDGNQGEWFYFSLAVLFVLGWVVGQFIVLDRRQRRHDESSPADELPECRVNTSHDDDGAQTWKLQFGSRPASGNESAASDVSQWTFSRNFQVPLTSTPLANLPSHESLACLGAELKRGIHIDEACQRVEPAFVNWNEPQRQAYRQYVTSKLNL